jgi:hypothetical protein
MANNKNFKIKALRCPTDVAAFARERGEPQSNSLCNPCMLSRTAWLSGHAPWSVAIRREALGQLEKQGISHMSVRRFCLALTAITSLALAACGAPQQQAAENQAETVSPTQQRIQDLTAINASLAAYHQANGAYPVSSGFQGYASNWGAGLGADWIPGLQTTALPRDPSMSDTPESQYLYFSDGVDYKLIAHLTGDCSAEIETNGVRIDPARRDATQCWAYGYWTPGGERF